MDEKTPINEVAKQVIASARSDLKQDEREKQEQHNAMVFELDLIDQEASNRRRQRRGSRDVVSYKSFYVGQLRPHLDRAAVLRAKGLWFEQKGKHFAVECPGCGEREAYLYMKGDTIICNRKNKCGFRISLPAFVVDSNTEVTSQQFAKGVRELAKINGTTVPNALDSKGAREAYKKREEKSRVLETIDKEMKSCLQDDSEAAQGARTYLKTRGFAEDGLNEIGLYDHERACQAVERHHPELVGPSTGHAYILNKLNIDPAQHNGRLYITHRDADGLCIGQHFRFVGDEPVYASGKPAPKVLTSKDLNKDVPLFLHEAGDCEELVVVEGDLDALVPRSHGMMDVVAVLGSRLTRGQANCLRNNTNVRTVILALDDDEAGRKGTPKSIENLVRVGIDVCVVEDFAYRDPETGDSLLANDPAELVQKVGIKEFEVVVERSPPFLASIAQDVLDDLADGGVPQREMNRVFGKAEKIAGKWRNAGISKAELDAYFWPSLEDGLTDLAGLTGDEFNTLRATVSPELRSENAQPIVNEFVQRVEAMTSIGDQKIALAEALHDDELCDALASLGAFGKKWLNKQFIRLKCTHGLKGGVQKILGFARDEGKVLQESRKRQVNPPLESKSHPILAKEAARRLSEDNPEDLLVDQNQVHRFNGTYWRVLQKHEVVQGIQSLDGHPVDVMTAKGPRLGTLELRSSDIKGAQEQLLSLADVAQPGFFEDAKLGVQFADVFVELNDDGSIEQLLPAREHRQRTAYEFDFDADAPCPLFQQALHDWFNGDPDAALKIQFLQEIAGCYLFGLGTRFELCLLLFGKGGNGKSVFLIILKAAFPKGSTCAIDPQVFDDDAKLVMLENKLLNVSADIPSADILGSSIFKRVISGDPTTARHLYQDAFEFRPRAGHVFACNELPRSRDLSNGFFDRVAVVAFNNDFRSRPKRRKKNLAKDIIESELPGVVAWMVKGAQRLVERGEFVLPPSALEMRSDWRESSDPVALWVSEQTHAVEPQADETMREAIKARGTQSTALYISFKEWGQDNGFRQITKTTFGTRLGNLVEKGKYSDANRYALSLLPLAEGLEPMPNRDSD
jgi:P4 family phage/plasmid primase-like protien